MRRISLVYIPTLLLSLTIQILGSFMPCRPSISTGNQALAAAPITPSGLNAQVSQPVTLPSGHTQYNLTGGTRLGGSRNLFHSSGDFNVPNTNIENLLNAGSVDLHGNALGSSLPTSNILARVTWGAPSRIFGTIQTNGAGGFGHANLLLMNPAGAILPSRIGLSEIQACYLPVGETCDSSFSRLTRDKDPHSNVAIRGTPTDEPVANFGG